MKKTLLQITLAFLVVFMSGCAASYKAINPTHLYYSAHSMRDGIEISYKYNVLQEKGNKKFSKKELKRDVQIVAIKLTNNTGRTVNIRKDLLFYAGDVPIYPMQPVDIKNAIRQSVPSYLPYILLTFVSVTGYEGASAVTVPVGLALGPGITAGNMAVAATANKHLLQELEQYNILDRDIAPGETVFGIIGVRHSGYGAITVHLKNKG
jgi:hypothetical protein